MKEMENIIKTRKGNVYLRHYLKEVNSRIRTQTAFKLLKPNKHKRDMEN
jgi:hypothetical protein